MTPFPGLLAASQRPALRVQLNQLDYTLISPGSLDNSSLPHVPVIRIYGATSIGRKACVHVHQVYPYFFVEYNGRLNAKHGLLFLKRPSDVRFDLPFQ
jgi:DNA polymerase zeta